MVGNNVTHPTFQPDSLFLPESELAELKNFWSESGFPGLKPNQPSMVLTLV
jgi:hypothetical protein